MLNYSYRRERQHLTLESVDLKMLGILDILGWCGRKALYYYEGNRKLSPFPAHKKRKKKKERKEKKRKKKRNIRR